jgi:hypothetical protein
MPKIIRHFAGNAAVLFLMLLAAPQAYAQGSDTIHACYNTNSGQLRRVSAPAECRNNETSLSWNASGPAGPQGPQGPAGPQGAEGAVGPQGPTVAVFPILRAREMVTTLDDPIFSPCFVGSLLGQAVIDPSWFGADGIDYRFVVLAQVGGPDSEAPHLRFDFCARNDLADFAGGTLLHSSVVPKTSLLSDSGWMAYEGDSLFRINLRAVRSSRNVSGLFEQAYVLVRPRQQHRQQ